MPLHESCLNSRRQVVMLLNGGDAWMKEGRGGPRTPHRTPQGIWKVDSAERSEGFLVSSSSQGPGKGAVTKPFANFSHLASESQVNE